MNCSSQGNPTPQCNFTICSGVCTTISNTDNDCFTRQFLTDDSSLSCLASNKVGSHESAATTITVIPASRNVTLSNDGNVIENKTMTQRIEDALILTCNIDYANELNTSFTWTGPNMTTLSRSVLSISSLNPFDTGNYICNTEDAFGSFINNIYVDVIYAPFQDNPTSCQWVLSQTGLCNVTFMSNPHSEFLALSKNNSGENVEGGKLVDDDDMFFQTFQFIKDNVTESDTGTYILHLHSSIPPYNYTIEFKVYKEESSTSGNNNTLVIALSVTGAVLAIIIMIAGVFTWYTKRKTSEKGGSDNTFHTFKPATVSSSSHYLAPMQPTDEHSYETIIAQPKSSKHSYKNVLAPDDESKRGVGNYINVEQNVKDGHSYETVIPQPTTRKHSYQNVLAPDDASRRDLQIYSNTQQNVQEHGANNEAALHDTHHQASSI